MGALARCYNIADLRRAARRRLPRGIFDYFDRGSEDETGLVENRAAFDRLRLRPRAPVDVSGRSPATTLFGRPLPVPMAVAPMSPAGFACYDAEMAMARAAAALGIPYTLATPSFAAIERIAPAAGGRFWFQLYVWNDRAASEALVDRAAAAGCEALLITVDTPVVPNREFNIRNGVATPVRPSLRLAADLACHPRWTTAVLLRYLATRGMPRLENYPKPSPRSIDLTPEPYRITGSLDWDAIAGWRRRWPGRLLVKGILRADDAIRAREAGADGVVVSNHGARNLDGAIASIDALPEIASAVGGETTILLDSGVRRGSDMLKALALGAQAVLVGRPCLFGAAVAGRAGVTHALALLAAEFDKTMANTGCRSVAEITADLIVSPSPRAAGRGGTRGEASGG